MSPIITRLKQYLLPPGDGVYTVHTAQDIKKKFQNRLYGPLNHDQMLGAWSKKLEEMLNKQSPFYILGICSDTGAGIIRGSNWGPLFIRNEWTKEKYQSPFFDLGDIKVIPHLLSDQYLNEETLRKCRLSLYDDENLDLAVSPLSITYEVCELLYALNPETKIFSLGGDHSISYPLVKSYLENSKKRGIKSAIIHFDAHTDLLDQRLGIPYCFATWAYHVLEFLEGPHLLQQIGIRSSGKDKTFWEKKLGIKQYWADEVLNRPLNEIAQEIIEKLKNENVQEIYLSFDIDALDSLYAGATGTPEKNGLAPHHATTLISLLAEEFPIGGADLVEVAPFINSDSEHPQVQKMTLMSADIISKRIKEVMSGDLTCPS